MPSDLNFVLKLSFFTMKYIENRKRFIEYRSPIEPTNAFACICVAILCIHLKSGVLVHLGDDIL